MKKILLASIAIIALTAGFSVHAVDAKKSSFDKPYTLILEKITQQDLDNCTKDENCMDIMEIKDIKDSVNIYCDKDYKHCDKEVDLVNMDDARERNQI